MNEEAVIPAVGNGDATPSDVFEIPEAYREKAYLKDVTSIDDVYKKLDGAQSLIGQKLTIPTDTSTPEEILKFNIAAGMPEKVDGYVFEKIGDLERVPEVDTKFKEIFHKYGINKKAAEGVTKDVETMLNEIEKVKANTDNAEFDNLTKEVLGDSSDSILASGKKLIEENIPDRFKEDFSKLGNKELVLMASILDNIKNKYISEDKINKDGSTQVGENKESLNTKMQELMRKRTAEGAFSPLYKDLSTQISAIAAKLAELS